MNTVFKGNRGDKDRENIRKEWRWRKRGKQTTYYTVLVASRAKKLGENCALSLDYEQVT